MNRRKLQYLGILALGSLVGPYLLSTGSTAFLQAQEVSKTAKQAPTPASSTDIALTPDGQRLRAQKIRFVKFHIQKLLPV